MVFHEFILQEKERNADLTNQKHRDCRFMTGSLFDGKDVFLGKGVDMIFQSDILQTNI
jgi:hypothetical protein